MLTTFFGSLPKFRLALAVGAFLGGLPVAEAARTFYWSMESDTPDVVPVGADATPTYYPDTTRRTDADSRTGKFSLDLSKGQWRAATFDNPTDQHVWASPAQGAVVIWFKYTQAPPGAMLFQITGKSKDKALDTNDGVGVRLRGDSELSLGYGWDNSRQSTSIRYRHGKPFTPGQWYKVTAKWNTTKAPYLSLQVDEGKPVTGETQPGATKAVAWHQLLIGNDTRAVSDGFYLDDIEVWNDFDMTGTTSTTQPSPPAQP